MFLPKTIFDKRNSKILKFCYNNSKRHFAWYSKSSILWQSHKNKSIECWAKRFFDICLRTNQVQKIIPKIPYNQKTASLPIIRRLLVSSRTCTTNSCCERRGIDPGLLNVQVMLVAWTSLVSSWRMLGTSKIFYVLNFHV